MSTAQYCIDMPDAFSADDVYTLLQQAITERDGHTDEITVYLGETIHIHYDFFNKEIWIEA